MTLFNTGKEMVGAYRECKLKAVQSSSRDFVFSLAELARPTRIISAFPVQTCFCGVLLGAEGVQQIVAKEDTRPTPEPTLRGSVDEEFCACAKPGSQPRKEERKQSVLRGIAAGLSRAVVIGLVKKSFDRSAVDAPAAGSAGDGHAYTEGIFEEGEALASGAAAMD